MGREGERDGGEGHCGSSRAQVLSVLPTDTILHRPRKNKIYTVLTFHARQTRSRHTHLQRLSPCPAASVSGAGRKARVEQEGSKAAPLPPERHLLPRRLAGVHAPAAIIVGIVYERKRRPARRWQRPRSGRAPAHVLGSFGSALRSGPPVPSRRGRRRRRRRRVPRFQGGGALVRLFSRRSSSSTAARRAPPRPRPVQVHHLGFPRGVVRAFVRGARHDRRQRRDRRMHRNSGHPRTMSHHSSACSTLCARED